MIKDLNFLGANVDGIWRVFISVMKTDENPDLNQFEDIIRSYKTLLTANMNVNKIKFQSRTTGKEKFSLLLVGPSDFCRIMSDHISATNKNMDHFPLSISTSESLELIVKSSESLHVDFIVFLMNTAHRHCLEIVERSICLVDAIYLCDKMVFVNGCNQLKPSSMGLTHDELFNLTQKYRLHMFHGNIKNDCSCINLAKRILNFMAAVCGAVTSVPMIMDFPTDRYPAS